MHPYVPGPVAESARMVFEFPRRDAEGKDRERRRPGGLGDGGGEIEGDRRLAASSAATRK